MFDFIVNVLTKFVVIMSNVLFGLTSEWEMWASKSPIQEKMKHYHTNKRITLFPVFEWEFFTKTTSNIGSFVGPEFVSKIDYESHKNVKKICLSDTSFVCLIRLCLLGVCRWSRCGFDC